ncbi:MAG TPA: MBL fold metallo-hydrolase [Candidatus Acidoferrales bacterium]|nr:MBL fold metallo-hydrolase [Candidatus Acidoferrales bacterium]
MKASLTVLGSGTSMGVPTIGCTCAVCHSPDPRDRRTRPSIMVEYEGKCVLIDTTPDFREQAIRENITHIDAIIYTHAHADHILGLDDVRPLSFRSPQKIPLYAHDSTAEALQSVFRYIFDATYKYGGIARVEMHRINGSLELFGATFEPVELRHGEATIHGFRFGSAAYLTDFSEIPPHSMDRLRDLDVLFLDALRHRPHPTHSTVANSLRLVEELRPRRAFFTHISHDLPHEETNKTFPDHVRLAHDGLKLEFEIA